MLFFSSAKQREGGKIHAADYIHFIGLDSPELINELLAGKNLLLYHHCLSLVEFKKQINVAN